MSCSVQLKTRNPVKTKKVNNVIHRTTSETIRLGEPEVLNNTPRQVMTTLAISPPSLKKSTCSFQITGVSLTQRTDFGDDSADDLDESHTDDISRVTDNETPSFSEDTCSRDAEDNFIGSCSAYAVTVIPTSSQYGLAIVPSETSSFPVSGVSECSFDLSIQKASAMSDKSKDKTQPRTPTTTETVVTTTARIPGTRFHIVKIETTTPIRRGRWSCIDYLDHSVNTPKNALTYKSPTSPEVSGTYPVPHYTMTATSPQLLPQEGANLGTNYAIPTTTLMQPIQTTLVTGNVNFPGSPHTHPQPGAQGGLGNVLPPTAFIGDIQPCGLPNIMKTHPAQMSSAENFTSYTNVIRQSQTFPVPISAPIQQLPTHPIPIGGITSTQGVIQNLFRQSSVPENQIYSGQSYANQSHTVQSSGQISSYPIQNPQNFQTALPSTGHGFIPTQIPPQPLQCPVPLQPFSGQQSINVPGSQNQGQFLPAPMFTVQTSQPLYAIQSSHIVYPCQAPMYIPQLPIPACNRIQLQASTMSTTTSNVVQSSSPLQLETSNIMNQSLITNNQILEGQSAPTYPGNPVPVINQQTNQRFTGVNNFCSIQNTYKSSSEPSIPTGMASSPLQSQTSNIMNQSLYTNNQILEGQSAPIFPVSQVPIINQQTSQTFTGGNNFSSIQNTCMSSSEPSIPTGMASSPLQSETSNIMNQSLYTNNQILEVQSVPTFPVSQVPIINQQTSQTFTGGNNFSSVQNTCMSSSEPSIPTGMATQNVGIMCSSPSAVYTTLPQPVFLSSNTQTAAISSFAGAIPTTPPISSFNTMPLSIPISATDSYSSVASTPNVPLTMSGSSTAVSAVSTSCSYSSIASSSSAANISVTMSTAPGESSTAASCSYSSAASSSTANNPVTMSDARGRSSTSSGAVSASCSHSAAASSSTVNPPVPVSAPQCDPSRAPRRSAAYINALASANNTSAIIDSKIEQAMDLVKSHLMFTVREEVEVLKLRITELLARISQLEMENNFLKANATPEVLNALNNRASSEDSQDDEPSTSGGGGGGGAGNGGGNGDENGGGEGPLPQ